MTMKYENEKMRYMHLREITNSFRVPDKNSLYKLRTDDGKT